MRLLKPAQLLPVRAIGKETHRIVLDGSQNQHVNAIEHLVGCREFAHLLRRAVNRLAAQAYHACAAFHLHVSESVVTESRMPGFNAFAGAHAA